MLFQPPHQCTCGIIISGGVAGELWNNLLSQTDDYHQQLSACYFLCGWVRRLKRSDDWVLKTNTHTLKYFPSQQFNISQALYRKQPPIHCNSLSLFCLFCVQRSPVLRGITEPCLKTCKFSFMLRPKCSDWLQCHVCVKLVILSPQSVSSLFGEAGTEVLCFKHLKENAHINLSPCFILIYTAYLTVIFATVFSQSLNFSTTGDNRDRRGCTYNYFLCLYHTFLKVSIQASWRF